MICICMTHHDRTCDANGTVVACLIETFPIVLLAEQLAISLTVPGFQKTTTVTAPKHINRRNE